MFEGANSHKTLPGGILSCFMTICLVAYAVLLFKGMVNKEKWTILQQTTL